MKCCEAQAFDAHVAGDETLESRLEFFNVIMQDYRESFLRSSVVRRAQVSFLCGQMLDILHRPSRRNVNRDGSSEEDNWDALLDLDVMNFQLLSVSQFMEKT